MTAADPSAHRRLLTGLCVCLLAVGQAHRADAAPLTAGGIEFLFGTTSAAEPHLAGAVQDDPLHHFEILGNFGEVLVSGNLQDRVARSNDTGTLIFSPRLRDLTGAPFAPDMEIRAIFLDGYAGVQTDVNYRTDGLGDVGPLAALRSFDDDTLQYVYDPGSLIPPDESLFMSTFTDATEFAPIGTARIVAHNLVSGEFFETTLTGINIPVPEPAAGVLLTLGLAAIGARRRR